MKIMAYNFITAIFFISLISTVQACDDEVDETALYDAYEFEAEND